MKLALVLLTLFTANVGWAGHAVSAAARRALAAAPPRSFPRFKFSGDEYKTFGQGERPSLGPAGTSAKDLVAAGRTIVEKSFLPRGCHARLQYATRSLVTYDLDCGGVPLGASSVTLFFDAGTNEVTNARTRALPKSYTESAPAISGARAEAAARAAFEKTVGAEVETIKAPKLDYLVGAGGTLVLTWHTFVKGSGDPFVYYEMWLSASGEPAKVMHAVDRTPLQ